MEYTQIISLVPEGEHFDASAINEGIWVSQAHFANIENRLSDNANVILQATEEANANLAAANTLGAEAIETLAQANVTIETQNTELATLQARITELENAPAGSFATTAKDKDDIGGNAQKAVSPVTAEANRLRKLRDNN